ncbi:conserved hypothetical protein [Vibrio chagasii]|nr:conserved hypothetical protein [Vibrio chagasii]CAH6906683.1 conserved hypothetical protein [Vibrio chagasii]CAH6912870.1 conserved hypothetical protein [Vibrio chagasii]CAH6962914.1 conserved hypothetical protein [Vibrio chagasii]CAH7152621.1 conserved hypothetical protein [Vibrio chagasii]
MNKILELSDGFNVEVEINEDEVFEISNGSVTDSSIDKVTDLLTKAVSPVTDAYKALQDKNTIESTKVTVGVKFGASGNVFVAKSSAEANITVEMVIRPKND